MHLTKLLALFCVYIGEGGMQMKKQIIKSISFVTLIHSLSVINMLLCRKDLITDFIWFALQILLCIVAIPLYFFVKGNTSNKWIYSLSLLVTHIVFALLVCFALGSIFVGWDNAIIYWTEIFLSASFGVVFLIDLIVNLKV